ncbi:hypothetical protein L249_4907, partial [Ophiocordyceps polyrhachis-furcata BCC 54312]
YIAYGYFPARYKESNVILTALIYSYLTSRSSRLKVDGCLSEPFDIERGLLEANSIIAGVRAAYA